MLLNEMIAAFLWGIKCGLAGVAFVVPFSAILAVVFVVVVPLMVGALNLGRYLAYGDEPDVAPQEDK